MADEGETKGAEAGSAPETETAPEAKARTQAGAERAADATPEPAVGADAADAGGKPADGTAGPTAREDRSVGADAADAGGKPADGTAGPTAREDRSVGNDTDEAKAGRLKAGLERDALEQAEHRMSMDVLDKALKGTDWEFTKKEGVDRQNGYLAMKQMERAFVHAAAGDRDGASKMYEESSGYPPPPELLKRVDDYKKDDFTTQIDDLSAGLSKLGGKDELSQLQRAEKSMRRDISGNVRDAHRAVQAAKDHGKQANEHLLHVEKHEKSETGLFMFRALRRGMKAGGEWNKGRYQKMVARHIQRGVKQDHAELGVIVKDIAGFGVKPTDAEPGATTGRTGTISRTMAGMGQFVAKAGGLRAASMAAAVAPKAPGVAKGPSVAAQAAQRDQGIGMG